MKVIEGIPTRDRSTIAFPYGDLDDAIKIAEALHKGGGTPMARDQLAAMMNQAAGSGSFNSKVNTARMFGVMDSATGRYQLTDLGFEIVDPARRADAMVRAFLNVELYRKTYEDFRGKRLPPRPLGLERTFVNYGVAPKQAKTARLSFEKSARLAGFYPNGDEDRLVVPIGSGGHLAPVTSGEAPEPQSIDAVATVAGPGPARAFAAHPPVQPLEYQLVDLLKAEGVTEDVSQAIWTLVRFLSARSKGDG